MLASAPSIPPAPPLTASGTRSWGAGKQGAPCTWLGSDRAWSPSSGQHRAQALDHYVVPTGASLMLSCGSVTLLNLQHGLEGRPRATLVKCPPCPGAENLMQVFTALARWLLPCSQSGLLEDIISPFPLYHKEKLEKDLETQEEEEKADPIMPTKPHLHLHSCPPGLGQQETSPTTAMPREIRMCVLHLAGAIPPATAANLR